MTQDTRNNAAAVLKGYIERIERITAEKKALSEDISDIKKEAKGTGFDPAMIDEMIRIRALDVDKWQEREHLRDTYLTALGLV